MMKRLLTTLSLLLACALPASAQFSSGGYIDQPPVGTSTDPTNPVTVNLTPSATANTQGVAVNLTTATAVVTNSVLLSIAGANGDSAGEGWLVNVSSSSTNSAGACVSPTALIPAVVIGFGAQFDTGGVNVLLPLTIPAGTCLQASVQTSHASSANTPVFNLVLMSGGFGANAIDNLSAITTTSLGTSVTPTTTGTFGSTFTTLVASTSHPYKGFWYAVDALSTSSGDYVPCAFQLATGASSSEIVFGPTETFQNESGQFAGYQNTPYIPFNVPSGTRISARSTCNGTQTAMGLSLYGVR